MRIQQQKLERNQVCDPCISQKSRDLVGNRAGKIEDRLLALSKSKELSSRDSQAPERIPQISEYAKSLKSDKPVVDRLLLYSKIYDEKRKVAQEKTLDLNFTPQINSYSTNVSRSDLASPKSVQKPELNYSFQPSINTKSSQIASKLGSFGARNTSKSRSYLKEDYSFKPQINKTSSEISLKPGEDRWKYLYDLNLQRRERLALLRKNFQDNEKDFECTFHPKTCKPLTSLSVSSSVRRLNDWEIKRLAKISKVRESSIDKDDEECTFKPSLYKNLTGQTTLTDFYLELEKKKKKNYVEIHRHKFTPDKIEWRSDKVAPLFISDINSNEYDEAIKELHDLLHVGLKTNIRN